MRVLVNMNSPLHIYMVRLSSADLIKEIRCLVSKREHSKAIVEVLSHGNIEWASGKYEMPNLKVDLMLSKTNAHWDLT